MALTIPVAHDFICPWCWVGLKQVRRLQEEFGIEVDWRGYELFPKNLEWPDYAPSAEPPANKPPVPSRFDFLLVADDVELPKVSRPQKMRTFNAHQAVEYAKSEGSADAFVEALYRAYWEEGRSINDMDELCEIARPFVKDLTAMAQAVAAEAFVAQIGYFDDEAHEAGIYNVPTFIISGRRYAEQPYAVLRKLIEGAVEDHAGIDVYFSLEFPEAPVDRPYIFINMVTTIDGKAVSGTRNESVEDLGSKTDHRLMKRIESAADAVMLGAQTLRVTSPLWNPKSRKRLVVTRSGHIPEGSKFLSEGESFLVTNGSGSIRVPPGSELIRAGGDDLDFEELMTRLRKNFGIERLLVTGGGDLNSQLLAADLVDELFLTIAPKVKLGRGVPTYADGEPFARDHMQKYSLVEHHVIGDEIFVRYRRDRGIQQ